MDAAAGIVFFAGPAAHPGKTPLDAAAHLRAWLTGTCATWREYQSGNDSTRLFRGQLAGVHPGVVLAFALRARLRPAGYLLRARALQRGGPNGQGFVHWLPRHRRLDDPDVRPDVIRFQQPLQRALPEL